MPPLVMTLLVPFIAAAGPDRSGEQIYRKQCASCHGASGEGTDDHYPRALIGERPLAALARFIAKTMPEDAPGECVGEDAEKVAAYIYDSFYSKVAQGRNKFQAPRIETLSSDRAPVPECGRRPGRELSRCPAAGTINGLEGRVLQREADEGAAAAMPAAAR